MNIVVFPEIARRNKQKGEAYHYGGVHNELNPTRLTHLFLISHLQSQEKMFYHSQSPHYLYTTSFISNHPSFQSAISMLNTVETV